MDIERAKINDNKLSEVRKASNETNNLIEFQLKSNPEYLQVFEENVELKLKLTKLTKSLEEKTEESERIKVQFQEIIKKQTENLKKSELILEEKKGTIEEVNIRLNQLSELIKKNDVDKLKLETRINDILKENKFFQKKIQGLEQVIVDKAKNLLDYEEKVFTQRSENARLSISLDKIKVAVLII